MTSLYLYLITMKSKHKFTDSLKYGTLTPPDLAMLLFIRNEDTNQLMVDYTTLKRINELIHKNIIHYTLDNILNTFYQMTKIKSFPLVIPKRKGYTEIGQLEKI